MSRVDSERRAVLGALSDEIRALMRQVVNVDAPPDVLRTVARGIADARAALAAHDAQPPLPRYPARDRLPDDLNELMPFDPVAGRLSPMAPPVEFRWEDGKSIGEVTYTKPYEGPPGCVHGGIIALAFDQVLSVANLMSGSPGPTASLRLRFRKPTPLGEPLRYEGWLERVAGRRIHSAGRLLAAGDVTVEAEGVYVHLPTDAVMRLRDQ